MGWNKFWLNVMGMTEDGTPLQKTGAVYGTYIQNAGGQAINISQQTQGPPLKPTSIEELLEGQIKTVEGGADWISNRIGINEPQIVSMGDLNVVRDYNWGVGNKVDRTDIPTIILTEYQPNSGPVIEGLKYSLEVAKLVGDVIDNDTVAPEIYTNMYQGSRTDNIYTLPFFSNYNHMINNTWDESTVESKSRTARNTVNSLASGLQYGLIEERNIWKSGTQGRYQFSFTLYNTMADLNTIIKNYKFMRCLVHNNLPSRTSIATMLPPCMYTLSIPGVRYAPAVIFESVTVENIGQVNSMEIPITDRFSDMLNIPDAWTITISVQELHTETRNIFAGVFADDQESRVNIINDPTDIAKTMDANQCMA